MGLDMNLNKKTYVQNWEDSPIEERFELNITKGGKEFNAIDTTKVVYIEEEVMYWRKANAIHKFFVDNCQGGNDDCRQSYVSRDTLIDLLNNINDILNDHSKADDLLPSQSGFFFGGTEYDEWYFQDLKATKEMLEQEMASPSWGKCSYYYQSSW
jgi:hypothetical protein